MTVTLNVNCGCGYKTGRLEEAIKHSETKHHRMTISGTIIPPPLQGAPRLVTPKEEITPVDLSAIERLRASIGNGKK